MKVPALAILFKKIIGVASAITVSGTRTGPASNSAAESRGSENISSDVATSTLATAVVRAHMRVTANGITTGIKSQTAGR